MTVNTPRFIVLTSLVIFLGSGGFIYYNGFVLNENISSKEMEEIPGRVAVSYARRLGRRQGVRKRRYSM